MKRKMIDSKIYVVGDIHGKIDIGKLNNRNFPEQKELTKNDYVIIVGDFGFPWIGLDSPEDNWWLDWINDKNFTTLFIDGNHENFNLLYKYPEKEFLGVNCHQLRDNVYHVKRGEVLKINDFKILCMGGANSHDKAYRKEGVSWWKEEEPTYNEWEKAFLNVEKADIILTHDAPYSVLRAMMLNVEENNVNKMLDRLFQRDLKATKWYFGHHHIDRKINYGGIEFCCLYDIIERME